MNQKKEPLTADAAFEAEAKWLAAFVEQHRTIGQGSVTRLREFAESALVHKGRCNHRREIADELVPFPAEEDRMYQRLILGEVLHQFQAFMTLLIGIVEESPSVLWHDFCAAEHVVRVTEYLDDILAEYVRHFSGDVAGSKATAIEKRCEAMLQGWMKGGAA